jgi:hypothetical protein
MHPHHAPFFRFLEITSALADLTPTQQVVLLKGELLHALERDGEGQTRCRALASELDRLKFYSATRNREHEIVCIELRRRLEQATGELASFQAEGERQVRTLRLEILAMEQQYQTLDEICRSLLLTIERAACFDTDAAVPNGPARETRMSA